MGDLDEDLFVSPEVIRRSVKLGDGKEREFHFRRYSGAVYSAHLAAAASRSPDVRETAIPHLVAASLCDEEGDPVLSVASACRLKPAVLAAFYTAVRELNEPRSEAAEKKV
ncbi:phage tail assembly chaperone family protein, TAC [Achromobacter aegrifaciens]|uniref:phage tail assembly chaperone family protein, TAC n=1 Tax=Achromobacter aegrifaciens TaxID=1287736 RepID=UPI0028AC9A31|nr:phage tail assembly chaperone family protein, TAC [Achromobacter aegrifaciens]